MSDEPVIRVTFGRPVPIFPLSGVVLFPHLPLPLHIFEDRYRQMVDDVLDSTGQIAMAVYKHGNSDAWGDEQPPVRPVVCLGQILQHHRLPDGRFYIALHGMCRALISRELPPQPGRLYREAILQPFGIPDMPNDHSLRPSRERFNAMLGSRPLSHLRAAENVLKQIKDPRIPTSAILELMTLSFINDNDLRYRLLATPDAAGRASLIESELEAIAKVLKQAQPQMEMDMPKGCCWN